MHVVSQYVCEYANDGSIYDEAVDEVYDMLIENGIDIHTSDDYTNRCDWEINCEDNAKVLRKYLAKLEKRPPEKVHINFKRVKSTEKYTNKNIADLLKTWLKYIDKEDDLIRIQWF